MEKFWELYEKSLIVTGVVTVLIVGTACYLFATQVEVPSLLAYAFTTILGFFFGQRLERSATIRRQAKSGE